MIIRLLEHGFESYIGVIKKLPINIGQLENEYFDWEWGTQFHKNREFKNDLDRVIYWIEDILIL